ncbi:hypothetical protein [Labrys sp. 22185]|uniref:hypothetical protein n=1 Tax=Labrys sp. 22185 TaxID=3453888 RepID=UPI003F835AED
MQRNQLKDRRRAFRDALFAQRLAEIAFQVGDKARDETFVILDKRHRQLFC